MVEAAYDRGEAAYGTEAAYGREEEAYGTEAVSSIWTCPKIYPICRPSRCHGRNPKTWIGNPLRHGLRNFPTRCPRGSHRKTPAPASNHLANPSQSGIRAVEELLLAA
jgi:hypothetical protein